MRFPEAPNILDADAAEELLRFFDKYPVLKIAGFSLWTFDEITPDAAKVIADSELLELVEHAFHENQDYWAERRQALVGAEPGRRRSSGRARARRGRSAALP